MFKKPNDNTKIKNPLNNVNSDTKPSGGRVDDRQFFIDAIAKFCDKCGTPYTINDIRVVRDTNFSSIIHFSCSNCKSQTRNNRVRSH